MNTPVKFAPARGLHLIRRTDNVETTKDGIIVPAETKRIYAEGVVEACGDPANAEHPYNWKPGDRVMFNHDKSSSLLEIAGVKYIIAMQQAIMGVLTDPAPECIPAGTIQFPAKN